MSKRIKLNEEEYFKTITAILMDFCVFMQETQGIKADIDNIKAFQKWVITKQQKLKNNGKEHIQFSTTA
jgi:hypothetical protein